MDSLSGNMRVSPSDVSSVSTQSKVKKLAANFEGGRTVGTDAAKLEGADKTAGARARVNLGSGVPKPVDSSSVQSSEKKIEQQYISYSKERADIRSQFKGLEKSNISNCKALMNKTIALLDARASLMVNLELKSGDKLWETFANDKKEMMKVIDDLEYIIQKGENTRADSPTISEDSFGYSGSSSPSTPVSPTKSEEKALKEKLILLWQNRLGEMRF